jgi:hypothetical protein
MQSLLAAHGGIEVAALRLRDILSEDGDHPAAGA